MKKVDTSRVALFAVMLLSTVAISSCSKKGGGGSGQTSTFLTCKIDGKSYEFNNQVNANDKPSEDIVHFVVIGGWQNEVVAKSPGFGIDLVSQDGATTKTYTTADAELSGKYYIQNYNGDVLTSTTVYNADGSDGTAFTLTITRLDANGVSGTFSGKLRGSGGVFLTVTDGAFSAPYN